MTPRERYRTLIRGEKPDRMPFWYGGPRASTFAAWRRQGLSENQEGNWAEFVGEEGFASIGKLDFEPLPRYEEVILEERGNERVWIDHYGVKRIDAIRQPTSGFSTRRYLEFPVNDRESFLRHADRYDPKTPERTEPVPGESERETSNPDGYRVEQGTEHWRDRVRACNEGDVPVSLTVPGLWWTLRDWCGFEGLCLMCSERPELVEEMMAFWTGFLLAVMEQPLNHIRVDQVILNEDMAYKTAAMLSPEMMRRFMFPNYLRLRRFFREKGVECVLMDSDGHCGQVLDVFFPEAIDGMTPLEIAANNDPALYLAMHSGVVIQGGIDKRELTAERGRVRAEVVRRYRLAREHPHYVPMVDHGVPPDVPLRNFLYLAELVQGFAQGEDLDSFEPSLGLEKELGPIEELFDPKAAYARAYGEG